LHVTVRGRVQGVGFRDFVRYRAESLGLRGHVRNLPDGRVEAVAEGPREALERLLGDVSSGPRGAEVHEVDVDWQDATGEFAGFRITF
jgi:acylphosphatase